MIGKMKIERLFLPGPAGKLEALLEFDATAIPKAAAIICHPHPLYGGTLHNRVVYRAAKAALQAGLPALRFNFRGVDKSEGEFADGLGERADARAALEDPQRAISRHPDRDNGILFRGLGRIDRGRRRRARAGARWARAAHWLG